MQTASKTMTYTCQHCNKRFSQSNILAAHLKIHTGKKPHQRVLCKERFSTWKYLAGYLRAHKRKDPHPCDKRQNFLLESDLQFDIVKRQVSCHQGSRSLKHSDRLQQRQQVILRTSFGIETRRSFLFYLLKTFCWMTIPSRWKSKGVFLQVRSVCSFLG